ncbi:MAPEG family protein [Chitinimonas arctica]|uniref:MAPEG family protein n=1 Tax=Chitinimonas arctica TaxID=2594795 RepID=UPI001CC45192|nr:MAPEG family protein [Chitinimonas arctica]
MTIAYSCLLIVVLLPYLWVAFAKAGRRADGTRIRYNNHAPRKQQASLEGMYARAVWAQDNAFEATPSFAAAVLVAIHAGVAADMVNGLAVAFVVLRVLHGVLYLGDKPALRSLSWVLGMAVVVGLFVMAITK